MESPDSDDVFEDFEEKVKDKKVIYKKPEKEIKKHHKHPSENEILKRRYQNEKQTLKEKYRKNMQDLHHEKVREELRKGKLKPGLGKVEKLTYIAIIIILLGYLITDLFIIDLSFSQAEKSSEAESKQDVTATVLKEENKTEEAEKEEILEEEPVEEEEEEELSGTITLTIDQIYKNLREDLGDGKGEISKIVFTVDNGKNKVLTPVVNAYIYDEESKDPYETKRRGQATYATGIPPGEKYTGSIDLSPKIYSNLDLKKNIRLALNDTEDGFITAVNDAILIS